MANNMSKVYEIVSKNIIKSIEKIKERRENGEDVRLPWDKGFDQSEFGIGANFNPCSPRNVKLLKDGKKPVTYYRNTNAIVTMAHQLGNNFKSEMYLPKGAFLKKGMRVRREEFGNPALIIFPIIRQETDDKGIERDVFKGIRYYPVWNLDQFNSGDYKTYLEGISLKRDPNEKPSFSVIKDVEKMVNDYLSREEINLEYGKVRSASYSPVLDRIKMPLKETWKSESQYYATLFHEMSHSTGHKSRLDRGLSTSFGSHEYSKEELVAEISSAFLCSNFKIIEKRPEIRDNYIAYIDSWLKVLKNDISILTDALIKARKSSDYILGISYDKKGGGK